MGETELSMVKEGHSAGMAFYLIPEKTEGISFTETGGGHFWQRERMKEYEDLKEEQSGRNMMSMWPQRSSGYHITHGFQAGYSLRNNGNQCVLSKGEELVNSIWCFLKHVSLS